MKKADNEKKRKMKSLTLQERILLCEIDEIDWNYNVTNDIWTNIQWEQEKLRTYGFTPLKTI